MRLVRLPGCGNCRKGSKIVIDTSMDDSVLPYRCCSECPWLGGVADEDVRKLDIPIDRIIASLCIDGYRTHSSIQSQECGQYEVLNFGSLPVNDELVISTINLRGRGYHNFHVDLSVYPDPTYASLKSAKIDEATIPYLAWQAIDNLRHYGRHVAVQRSHNGKGSHWVYLEGYFNDRSGKFFKSRWQVKWSV